MSFLVTRENFPFSNSDLQWYLKSHGSVPFCVLVAYVFTSRRLLLTTMTDIEDAAPEAVNLLTAAPDALLRDTENILPRPSSILHLYLVVKQPDPSVSQTT